MTDAPHDDDVGARLGSELGAIKIPPRPAVLSRIEKEMRSTAPNLNELEKLISADVGISASLVKMANSAYFGFGGQVRSVKDALQVLGLRAVASSIAALSLLKAFAHVPNLERFWDSSTHIAQLSGWLTTQLDLDNARIRPEEAYTFGLFRDCGIPVLLSMYADYLEILKLSNAADTTCFTVVEETALDLPVNHAMVGATMAKEWQLPIEFQAAIEWHHDSDTIRGFSSHLAPEASRYFIALTQLAEHLYQRLTGLNKTCEWGKLGAACAALLGVEEADIDSLAERAEAASIHTQPSF